MKEKNKIDVEVLQEEAKNSEGQESFRVLERSLDHRIGVGARLTPSDHPSYFLEVLIYLCPGSSTVNLHSLESKLMLLKELQARGYSLNCEGNCISCETTVPPQKLAAECETIESITKKIFQYHLFAEK